MTEFEIFVAEPKALQQAAKELLNVFAKDKIFAIFAPMGAGKTTFIKSLGAELQIKDTVLSPTFSIINEYLCSNLDVVFHFDYYRIKSVREAVELDSDAYFNSGFYCFIEWPELIEEILPERYVRVEIDVVGENERIIRAKLIEK